MSEPMSPAQLEQTASADADAGSIRVHAALLKLAGEPNSRQAFFRKALTLIGKSLASPYAALHVRLSAEVIDEEFHSGPSDPGFWRPTVQQFLVESLAAGAARARLLSACGSDLKVALLCCPIYDACAGRPGAIALVTKSAGDDLRDKLVTLESLATLVSHLVSGVGPAGAAAARSSDAGPSASIGKAATYESVEQLAFSLTNNLRNKLGCEQVALGLVRGRSCRIVSISGLDDVSPRSPGVKHVVAAMEECLDAGRPLVRQNDESWGEDRLSTGHRLHRHWSEAVGGANVASIPLRDGGEIAAILSIRRRADETFARDAIEKLTATVEPFTPAFRLLRGARRSLLRHAADSLGEQTGRLLGPGRFGRKALATAAVCAAYWLAFGSLGYVVTAPCRVVAAESRVVAAPFDGVLGEIRVKPGDAVRAGDVLLALDTRELELERRAHESQIAVFEQERLRAMADDKPAEARLAEVSRALEESRLALVEERIRRSCILAPHDGVIVEGELRQRVGAPLTRGEALVSIAPPTGWKVEIDAPQHAAACVQAGLTGRFASHARPDLALPLRVAALSPRAEMRNQRSVYVAEAQIAESAGWIKPGMEGVARVDCGSRPAWWVLSHRAIDYLHVNWWL